ncbi:MAG: TolB family protein [Gemmatimonadota bacterium]
MRARAVLRLLPVLTVLPVTAGCLADAPGHLPSSVRVLYSRTTRDSLGEKVDVYFLLAREGNELRLTEDEAEDVQPVFSSGLRRVFFVRQEDGASGIWSMDLGGGDETSVLSAAGESFRDPDVSPDGAAIAYTHAAPGGSAVEIAAVDGSDARELVGGSGSWSQPRWSPDGRRLVVVGRQGGAARLYLIDAGGGDPRPLTGADPGLSQTDPDWSPDGRRIVYSQGEGQAAEIAVIDVDGGATTTLTENDTEDAAPAFSPSGERIVFVSRRPDGRWNLWVMNADGSNSASLTTLEDGEEAATPDWL